MISFLRDDYQRTHPIANALLGNPTGTVVVVVDSEIVAEILVGLAEAVGAGTGSSASEAESEAASGTAVDDSVASDSIVGNDADCAGFDWN